MDKTDETVLSNFFFLTFAPQEHPLKTEKSKPTPHSPIQYCCGLKTDVYNSGVKQNWIRGRGK